MLLGKYGQSKTIHFDLFQPDGVNFESSATFATGDVKIMLDEGAEVDTTNLPVDEGQGYSLVLTAAEMSAARIKVYIVDQTATKVWLDTSVYIETYGNASAEHAFDLDAANVTLAAVTHSGAVIPTVTNLTNLPAITPNWLTATGIAAGALNGKGDWNIGKTGYSIAGTKTTLDALNDLSAPQVKTEVDNALDTAIPATPTADSINERIKAIDDLTQAGGPGDLAAILADTADIQPKLGTPAVDISADIAAVKSDTAAILIDTNELQGDWTDGGRLDLILDAIKADTGSTGVVLTAAERIAIADALLDRDMGAGSDSGTNIVRTVRQALRSNRNRVAIAGGTMTVYKEDDATASWSAAVTTTAGNPVTEIDPT